MHQLNQHRGRNNLAIRNYNSQFFQNKLFWKWYFHHQNKNMIIKSDLLYLCNLYLDTFISKKIHQQQFLQRKLKEILLQKQDTQYLRNLDRVIQALLSSYHSWKLHLCIHNHRLSILWPCRLLYHIAMFHKFRPPLLFSYILSHVSYHPSTVLCKCNRLTCNIGQVHVSHLLTNLLHRKIHLPKSFFQTLPFLHLHLVLLRMLPHMFVPKNFPLLPNHTSNFLQIIRFEKNRNYRARYPVIKMRDLKILS